jgi:DNA-binding NtrC family response regulator
MTRSLLIVDDARIRASLARSLREVSDAIVVAESGEDALKRIALLRPDVVLSDVRMPGMDGMELLRLLRERSPDVDVILMTAYDDHPLVAAAMHEGATDFLVKPLDLHHLRRLLERVFEDRAARASQRGRGDAGASAPLATAGRGSGSARGRCSRERTALRLRGARGAQPRSPRSLGARSLRSRSREQPRHT